MPGNWLKSLATWAGPGGVAFIIAWIVVAAIGSGAECLDSTDYGNGLVICNEYESVLGFPKNSAPEWWGVIAGLMVSAINVILQLARPSQ
jgi:hypothetical protein